LPLLTRLERHGVADEDEVLKEFRGNVLVRPAMLGKLQRHVEHVEAVEAHPPRAVRLFEHAARGQGLGAVEEANVVEPQEAALEDVLAFLVLTVDPPGEVHEEFLEHALKEVEILYAVHLALDLEDTERRPGMDG